MEMDDPLPAGRNSQGHCVHDGILYVYGGRIQTGRINDLWMFDPSLRRWTCLSENDHPKAPRVRSGCFLVHDGTNSLYVGFGYTTDPVSRSDVYRFDLHTREWHEISPAQGPIPPSRINFRAWHWNDHIYIFGGSSDGQMCLGDLWRLNLTTRMWNAVAASGPAPPPCQWSSIMPWTDDVVVVFGGQLQEGTSAIVFHLFDCSRNAWTSLIENEGPEVTNATEEEDEDEEDVGQVQWADVMVSSAGVAMWDERYLFIFGGWNGADHRSTLWCVDLETHTWTKVAGRYACPVNRASASLIIHDDRLFVFSGWNGWNQVQDFYSIGFKFPTLQRLCLEIISKTAPLLLEGDNSPIDLSLLNL